MKRKFACLEQDQASAPVAEQQQQPSTTATTTTSAPAGRRSQIVYEAPEVIYDWGFYPRYTRQSRVYQRQWEMQQQQEQQRLQAAVAWAEAEYYCLNE